MEALSKLELFLWFLFTFRIMSNAMCVDDASSDEEPPPQQFKATLINFQASGDLRIQHGQCMRGPEHSIVLDDDGSMPPWRAKSSKGAHPPVPGETVTSTWLTVAGVSSVKTNKITMPSGVTVEAAVYLFDAETNYHRRVVAPSPDFFAVQRQVVRDTDGYGLHVSLPLSDGVRQLGVMVDYFEIDTAGGGHPAAEAGLCPVRGPPVYVVVSFREC